MSRPFFGLPSRLTTESTRKRKLDARGRFTLESLEARQLMYAGGLELFPTVMASSDSEASAQVAAANTAGGPDFAGSWGVGAAGAAASAVGVLGTQVSIGPIVPVSIRDIQMGLPLLDSLPGAPATLYLDFNGNFESDWTTGGTHYTNISTPVFDTDGNTANYSASEQAIIKEVWARVSEDYAPFNINVSTDYYGAFANGQALRVAIGGNNTDWLHADASGISSIGSFHDSAVNTVFAFDMIAWAKAGVSDSEGHAMNGPAAMATTISHEAGHAFGLDHHSLYNSSGTLVNIYDPGTATWTPIMGNNKASDRTTWSNGPDDRGSNSLQDDMAIIAAANNGFGYRADDHAGTIAGADALVQTGITIISPMTGKGIINQASDVDAFKFTSSGGSFQATVNAAQFGANLMPVVEVWSASGLIARGAVGTSGQSSVSVNLGSGTYYVLVKGAGDYGDAGQYTVSVTRTLLTAQNYVNTSPFAGSITTTAASTPTTVTAPAVTSSAGKPARALGIGQETPGATTPTPTTFAAKNAFFANLAADGSDAMPLAPKVSDLWSAVSARSLGASLGKLSAAV